MNGVGALRISGEYGMPCLVVGDGLPFLGIDESILLLEARNYSLDGIFEVLGQDPVCGPPGQPATPLR